MSKDRPLPLAAVLFAYVLPLLGVAVLLALSGLWGFALLLVGGEAVMATVVTVVRRRPARTNTAPSRRPWLVPLVMVVLLGAMVAAAALASRAG